MPVRKRLRAELPPAASDLKTRLVAEWRRSQSDQSQPVIIEDSGGANQPLHVYVIWDEWDDLDMVDRSEIIMDAYAERYGRDQNLNVTVAMGLTSIEADRMGIRYA